MRAAFITLASDDYFLGAQQLFQSIKLKTKVREYKCILLSNEEHAQEFFGDLFDEIQRFPAISVEVPSSLVVPRFEFTLNKLYALAYLEQSGFDRVIFLDSDLMCLSNLDFLLHSDLNDYQILAVLDLACERYYPIEISNLGLNPSKIFNTGCFILNKSILDTLDYKNLITKVTTSVKSYDGSDQGYWNFVVQNSEVKFGELPLRFNYPLDMNYPLIWRPPALVHFTGAKPWNFASHNPYWDKAIYKYFSFKSKLPEWFDELAFKQIWYLRNIFINVLRVSKKSLYVLKRLSRYCRCLYKTDL